MNTNSSACTRRSGRPGSGCYSPWCQNPLIRGAARCLSLPETLAWLALTPDSRTPGESGGTRSVAFPGRVPRKEAGEKAHDLCGAVPAPRGPGGPSGRTRPAASSFLPGSNRQAYRLPVRLALALGGTLTLAGCFFDRAMCGLAFCSSCAPSIQVFVRDTTGHPVRNVDVIGVEAACATEPVTGETLCQAQAPAAHYRLTFAAPGYASGTLELDVHTAPALGGEDCCGTCAWSSPMLVELAPLP